MIQDRPSVNQPDLCTVLDLAGDKVKSSMNCVSIGTIQTFYPANQTADVALNYKIWQGNSPSTPVVSYPLLVNCPVVILNGGGSYITFPIKEGDSCLVLFCDREMDTWFTNGGTNAPQSARVHDLNDGIALVGIYNSLNSLSNYYTDGIYLVSPYIKSSNSFGVGNGATGTFTSDDGKLITVVEGIIVSIQ